MRRFLLISIPISLTLAVIVSSLMAYLACAAPFQPGSALFPLQEFAEEKRADLAFSNTDRAIYRLELAEQRVLDLLELARTDREVAALRALDRALDQAEIAVAAAPAEDLPCRFVPVSNDSCRV